MLYRQLTAWSPIVGAALPRAAAQTFRAGEDPRSALSALLRQRYGKDACALYASGTQALQAALQLALQIRDGVVLLPAYTCYEVATAAVGAQARVVLYDVDAETLEPDWHSLLSVTTQPVSALVVTPLYGLPLDWQAARAAATQLNALLIADAAQAFGTMSHGVPAGADADLTVLSFGRGKGWTGGGGGALLGATGATTGEVRQSPSELATVIKTTLQWVMGRPALYGLPAAVPFLRLGETVYHDPVQPSGMTRTSAFLILENEGEALAEVLRRRRNAQEYTNRLVDPSGNVTAVVGSRLDESSGALRYPLRLREGWQALRRTAASKLGAAGGYPTTLRGLPALRPLLCDANGPLPQSELLVRELITLPTHSCVSAAEREALLTMICGAKSTTTLRNVAQVRHSEAGANA